MSEHAPSRGLAIPVRVETGAAALLGGALAGGVAAADGGFFPESWAWVSVTTLFLSTLLLILRSSVSLRALDLAYLGGLLAFGSWVALSSVWSTTMTGSVEDAWRVLAYVGAVALCLLAVERRSVPALLGGVLTGVTLVGGYALLTRLLPDRLGDFESLSTLRLADPIGYWNGLGIYCVMGSLLALGFAARAERVVWRMSAAAVPVILLTAMYLTFSRGSWIGLGAGLIAAVALDPRRLQLLLTALVLAPWVALSVVAAGRADALSVEGSSLDLATGDGHVLLVYVGLFASAAAVSVALLVREERTREVGRRARTAFAAALVALALVGAGLVWAEYGSPWSLADRAWSDFRSDPRGAADLSDRLFDLSSNGRLELWGIAWDDFKSSPVLGEGAGSFEQSFYERRYSTQTARDGHSLYAETLGELGVIGLVLLLAALAVPVAAVIVARRHRLTAGAFGVYAAFLVHAGVDWDWELAGVTLVALSAAAALLVLAREGPAPIELSSAQRVGAVSVAVVLSGLALWSLLALVPLGRAREAVLRGDWTEAVDNAETARRFAPWASDPWRIQGDAEVALGDVAAARRSFRRAVEKEPGEWLPWLQLATTAMGTEQLEALARARALNPNEEQIRIVEEAVRNSSEQR